MTKRIHWTFASITFATLIILLYTPSVCHSYFVPSERLNDSVPPTIRHVRERPVESPTIGFYSEMGGIGLSLWSIHLEYTVFRFNHNPTSLGLSHSIRASAGYSIDGYRLPLSVKYILLESSHHIETGLAVTFPLKYQSVNDAFPNNTAVGMFTLGYRYEPQDGGGQFRVYYSPWFDLTTGTVHSWAGLSLGFAF